MQQLADETILRLATKRPSRAERAMEALGPWNPAAGFFHAATKNVQFGDIRNPETMIGSSAFPGALPEPVKRYPGRPTIQLPVATVGREFPRVLLARRTHRQFSSKAVGLSELAALLQFTMGFQGWLSVRPRNLAPLRTSPSAGARHPIEAYVLVRNIDDLAPGTYHYASDRHRLERLEDSSSPCPIRRYVPSQEWFESAAALVIFVARFTQTRWRYPYSRAYRSVLIEAGHLCQTFCLTATWLGLAPFSTAAFDDEAVERDLRVDGIRESAVYVAGVGRPHSVRSRRLSPTETRDLHVVRNPVFSKRRR
jgi:SagB-type dehydrogenase family enzyme